MRIENIFNYSNKFFLFLFIIFGIGAFDQTFGFHLNLWYQEFYPFTLSNQKGWRSIVWSENGIIELLQALLLFLTLLFLFNNLIKKNLNIPKLIKIFLIIEFLGLFYFFMEEISWGQHFFKFTTPELIKNLNHQNEFNLHNISQIFNQLPRNLVLLWCTFSIPIIKLMKVKENKDLYKIINPENKMIIISFIIMIFTIPNFILSNFDLINYQKLNLNGAYDFKIFFSIVLSFNFLKLSEVQEFLFSYYFLWHTLFLIKSIKKNENSNYNF